MIPKECKRLAEVDFPIAIVGKHSLAEKARRSGTPHQLHLWWAWRPLAACRAMLMALLLPNPCDENCPSDFKDKARKLLLKTEGNVGTSDKDLRDKLLHFIGDFSNWDNSSHPVYLEVSRGLVKAAYPEEVPLVVDPFAGGGSIPLEALRLGCETFASDLNPVACLILKSKLKDIPRQGPELADELRKVGKEIKEKAEKELAEFYPKDPDGATPIAYLWARTIRCEAPNCGAKIPLMRSFWLCKKANRKKALRYTATKKSEPPGFGIGPFGHGEFGTGCFPEPQFEIFEPKSDKEVQNGTVTRAKATCLACGAVLPPERVRAQLAVQRGGADAAVNDKGVHGGGARLMAVVTLREGEPGRRYRLPTKEDYQAVYKAKRKLKQILDGWEKNGKQGLCPVPDEPTPVGGGSGAGRAFSVQKYGMMTFADLFTQRQKLSLVKLVREIINIETVETRELLALSLSKLTERNNAICDWMVGVECPGHLYTQQVIPTSWDFAEAVPLGESSGSFELSVKHTAMNAQTCHTGSTCTADIQLLDAAELSLPDESCNLFFTDPPYYDAVPYSDLADFFFVWLKRVFSNHQLLRDPFDSHNLLTPKQREAIQDESREYQGRPKDRNFFEERMTMAFSEGCRILKEDGLGCIVFAHKTTEGWESLLSGVIAGGWVITASWPIATERSARMRAHESAALESSVHLICRPRSKDATIGDWSFVLRELPVRVGDWIERLQSEGIRGADLVFACIGPALELYSKYSKVEDAEGNVIPLGGAPEAVEPQKRGFLAYVWETVGRVALEQVLGTAEARARNGVVGVLEEDARLTALFLWTLQSTNSNNQSHDSNGAVEADDVEVETDEEDEEAPRTKTKGFSLIFDVVRRFAQPLGIHLDDWEGRIIETEKGVVRLLSVAERAKQLFGEDGATAIADRLEQDEKVSPQMMLFPEEAAVPRIRGSRTGRKASTEVSDEALKARREATTLDRVHAAMLLQANGRANALRALIKAEQDRGPDFLRLANALSALYPKNSEEKRLIDAMLLAVPR